MESVAIIGIGCRFPGAPDPRAFWQLLSHGGDAITEVPANRYDINAVYDPRPATPGKVMSRYGGFLKQVDQFDAAFFGISPREAAKIDPQHRLLLEVAWEAMEDAGQVPSAMTDEEKLNIGCFIGVITGDYWDRQFHNPAALDVYATAGSARSGSAGRISFSQDLMGTSFAIDAACSSSLVAVDQAVQNLRSGACTMAVAGGVNIILNPDHTIGFSQGKMMAADGRCKSYDAAADGYVRSEGAGVVVLKLLSQAQADGDRIHAVIRGCAANNDGHCESFMAPSTVGQQAGLRKACRNAGVEPRSISYVEAHGPGTKAGDPIEITTLGEVLCAGRPADQPLLVGSVKTNIGHTEGAAGVAGLIKAVFCLQQKKITPNLHFHTPSPAIPWQDYAVKIPTELTPWPPYASHPRRAVVCSYGIAGTNTYVILEEAPQLVKSSSPLEQSVSPATDLLTLSARAPEALKDLAQCYIMHLEDEAYAHQTVRDITASTSLRRAHFDYRLAVVSRSKDDARAKLTSFLRGETGPEVSSRCQLDHARQKIAWIFPGQGSQWLGMGGDLLVQEPVFRATIEECDRLIRRFTDWSLLEQLRSDEDRSRLNEIDVIQPTLFAIDVALAALWRSWGIEPDVVVGHSMGEVAAAYIAGGLSLEDATWIICARSKLLLRVSGKGAMAAVELSLEDARALVSDYEERVSVAVSNSPNSTVLSGDPEVLATILRDLEDRGIFGRLVKVDVASHSPQMDPLRDDLLGLMQNIKPRQATVPIFSTLKGALVEGGDLTGSYWVDNLREPVLFLSAIQTLLEDGVGIFMEVSPHPILIGAIRQTIEQSGKTGLVLASLRREEDGRAALLATLGSLYTLGYDPLWDGVYPVRGPHVSLPTYPWQRQRHWNSALDRFAPGNGSSFRNEQGHPLLGTSTPSALDPQTFFWTTTLDGAAFPYLSEHCVHDMPVLACAAYIELSLAAATEIYGPQGFRVEDLTLRKALFFPQGVTQKVQVVLAPDETGQVSLRFFSTPVAQDTHDRPWTLHATATLQRVDAQLTHKPIAHPTPEEVQSAWSLALDAATYYPTLRARGIQHGPLFQGITHIWRRPGEVMARITIPEDLIEDLPGYQVHPALLDSVLQGITPFLPEEQEDETYVPVAVREIRLFQQPGAGETLWTYATVDPASSGEGELEGDVVLLNAEGHVLLEALGFRLQSLDSGNTREFLRQRLNQLLYTIQWEEQALVQAEPEMLRKNWLIFSDQDGLGKRLAAQLQASGAHCVLVTPGQSYRQVAPQEYILSPSAPGEFLRLFNELYAVNAEAAQGIVYLWGLHTTPVNAGLLDLNQSSAEIGALHLLQAIAAAGSATTSRLWLVTRNAQTVAAGECTTGLLQAPLWGLGRVIVYEHQDLHSTLIDVDQLEQSAMLLQEIRSDNEADEVALRGEKRYVARLARYHLEGEQDQPLFRADGTYMITGGLGGVGLRAAQWMVEQGARCLVLLGRHSMPESARDAVEALRATGADVRIMQGDVSQEQQLAALLDEIRSELPPLRGVFHSAVVLDDGTLLQQNQERFLGVRAPKVAGAWNLHCLTLHDPLDYFVLFSSAASLIGSPGQGNYAAANTFMDQLAHYRRQQGYPAISINWGRWGEVGQAIKEKRGERLDNRGFASMKPTEGLAVLGELLHQSPPQIGVMSFQLLRWSQFYPNLTRSSLFTHLYAEAETKEEEKARELRLTRAMLVERDNEQRGQLLEQYLNDQIARVLGHATLKLERHQQLNRLGIDSLMSVELKNRIGSDLSVSIPVTILLQGTTLDQLITQIVEQI